MVLGFVACVVFLLHSVGLTAVMAEWSNMEEEMLVHFEELVHFNIFLLMLVFIAIIALNVRLTQSPHVWAWLGIGMPRGTTCAAVIRARNDAAHPNWQSDAAAQETARQALASGAQAILADITKLRAFSWGAFALIMCSMAVLVDVMVETEMFAFLFFLAFGLFILIAGIIYAMVRARARVLAQPFRPLLGDMASRT